MSGWGAVPTKVHYNWFWLWDSGLQAVGLSEFDPAAAEEAGLRAVACGLAMQKAMARYASVTTPTGATLSMGIKVAVVADRGGDGELIAGIGFGGNVVGPWQTLVAFEIARLLHSQRKPPTLPH